MYRKVIPVILLASLIWACEPVSEEEAPAERVPLTGETTSTDSEEILLTGALAPEDCLPGPVRPSEILVMVTGDGAGGVNVEPSRVVVSDPAQEVIWVAPEGEIKDITFKSNSCGNELPPGIQNQASRISHRFPSDKGRFKGIVSYGFMFHPASGDPIEVDPYIIIEY